MVTRAIKVIVARLWNWDAEHLHDVHVHSYLGRPRCSTQDLPGLGVESGTMIFIFKARSNLRCQWFCRRLPFRLLRGETSDKSSHAMEPNLSFKEGCARHLPPTGRFLYGLGTGFRAWLLAVTSPALISSGVATLHFALFGSTRKSRGQARSRS